MADLAAVRGVRVSTVRTVGLAVLSEQVDVDGLAVDDTSRGIGAAASVATGGDARIREDLGQVNLGGLVRGSDLVPTVAPVATESIGTVYGTVAHGASLATGTSDALAHVLTIVGVSKSATGRQRQNEHSN